MHFCIVKTSLASALSLIVYFKRLLRLSHSMKYKNEDDRFAPASSFLCKADRLPYESRYHYL